MEIDHVAYDVPRFGFLFEDVAHAGNAVLKPDGAHRHGRRVENQGVLGLDLVELELETQFACEVIKDVAQDVDAVGESVYRDAAPLAAERQRREQSRKTEHMVAVEMRQEDVAQTRELETLGLELPLGALAAVYHI